MLIPISALTHHLYIFPTNAHPPSPNSLASSTTHLFPKTPPSSVLSDSDLPHVDDATDAVTRFHVLEGLIDLGQGLAVSNELVDLELAVEVVLDEAGKLAAALDAAERTSLPHTAGDQLER